MPVVLRQQGYTFFFYANEGNPLEAAHIHVPPVSDKQGPKQSSGWFPSSN